MRPAEQQGPAERQLVLTKCRRCSGNSRPSVASQNKPGDPIRPMPLGQILHEASGKARFWCRGNLVFSNISQLILNFLFDTQTIEAYNAINNACGGRGYR